MATSLFFGFVGLWQW